MHGAGGQRVESVVLTRVLERAGGEKDVDQHAVGDEVSGGPLGCARPVTEDPEHRAEGVASECRDRRVSSRDEPVHEEPEQVAVREQTHIGRPQLGAGVGSRRDGLHRLDHALARPLVELEEELLLRPEEPDDVRLGHPRGAGDLIGGRPGVATFGEHGQRRGEDLLAPRVPRHAPGRLRALDRTHGQQVISQLLASARLMIGRQPRLVRPEPHGSAPPRTGHSVGAEFMVTLDNLVMTDAVPVIQAPMCGPGVAPVIPHRVHPELRDARARGVDPRGPMGPASHVRRRDHARHPRAEGLSWQSAFWVDVLLALVVVRGTEDYPAAGSSSSCSSTDSSSAGLRYGSASPA
ncbi:hypothetical protein GALL_351600 [mine drainage metagenome]|uniref:Uncharacterized protein n=1 Tax=mine drainage metagenome TaxID=410659 RepID=A0A1J5QT48_9ZZZZ